MTISINSEYFGMTFWFDVNNDLMYAPSFVDGGYDKDCAGYVSEWDDWEGVNISLLFDIHKACLFNKREYAGSITLNGV